jgi:hypothetical protein
VKQVSQVDRIISWHPVNFNIFFQHFTPPIKADPVAANAQENLKTLKNMPAKPILKISRAFAASFGNVCNLFPFIQLQNKKDNNCHTAKYKKEANSKD